MLFKNARIYQLIKPINRTAMEACLAQIPARECSPMEASTAGWAPPGSLDSSPLAHAQLQIDLLCMVTHTKMLPAAVINKETAKRVREVENREQRLVRKRELNNIKEAVEQELLPKAFQKDKATFAYIDHTRQLLIIDSAGAKDAENLITLLRQALGSLPLKPLETESSPMLIMTGWLQTGVEPASFSLAYDATLSRSLEGGTEKATLKNQELDTEEVEAHLHAGKQVESLRLNWMDKIAATIHSDLVIKRIKFSDIVAERISDIHADTEAARIDDRLCIMSEELGEFITDLVSTFDGYRVEHGDPA